MTTGSWFTAAGYLTGFLVLVAAAKRSRLATEGMALVAAVGFVCAILGARISESLAEGTFSTFLTPGVGGRSLLGGILFGWLGIELTKRWLGIRTSTGDMFALALPAGEAVGRIGCHLNGCCYGIPYEGPFAIWQHGESRFPIQLLSSLTAALLFLTMLTLRRGVRRDGELFRLFLIGFGATRFFIEFLRVRQPAALGLSLVQWVCLELVIYGLVWVWLRKRSTNLPQPVVEVHHHV